MKKVRPHLPVIIFSGAFTLPEMVIAFVDAFVFTGDGPDRLIDKIAELVPQPGRIRDGKSGQESTKGAA
jgi:hypothetical protein